MGFWSKLGKGLLKAAPIAASFIPGVGPIAGMAIGAATGAASKKLSGGSWKDAAMAGAEGGASGYGSAKGLGPSATVKDKIGSALGKYGISMPDDQYKYRTPPYVSDQQGGSSRFGGGYAGNYADPDEQQSPSGSGRKGGVSGFIDKLGGAKGIAGIAAGVGGAIAGKKLYDKYSDRGEELPQPTYAPRSMDQSSDPGLSRFANRMRNQLGPVMGQQDQNMPNLAMSIGQGRMDAMSDQPFRGGHQTRTLSGYDEEDNPTYDIQDMPRIGPGRRRGNRGYQYPQFETTQ